MFGFKAIDCSCDKICDDETEGEESWRSEERGLQVREREPRSARELVHRWIGFLEVAWVQYCSIHWSRDASAGLHSNGHRCCAKTREVP